MSSRSVSYFKDNSKRLHQFLNYILVQRRMKNKVCIVHLFIKILNEYERLSLESIYDTFLTMRGLVTFKENDLNIKYFTNIFFDKNYFKNIKTYNQLCFNLDFYQVY